MPETAPTIQDEAGVTRTPTGTIVDQTPTSTPPSETIVRPPPTPSTTPETKTDAKPPETGKSLLNEKSEGPKGAPAKYEDFKVPEGFTLDPEVTNEVGPLFKELDLNQAGAQKLVDFYIKHTREALEAPFNAYADKRQQWRDQISVDPEIGGSKLNGTIASVGRLIDSVGDTKLAESFRQAMDDTGAGDHPAIVKMLERFARRLTEGGAVRGNGPVKLGDQGQTVLDPNQGGRPSAAQALYPNLPTRG